jgi:tetraacyldisaccharide 4'-kinase
MLARRLEGASVLVSPDRYLAGCLAEHLLGATVHVLDDGFQHLQLERDVDLLIIGRDDVARPVTLPGGRLREPLDSLIAADAVVAADDDVQIDVGNLDIPLFRVRRRLDSPTGFSGAHAAGGNFALEPSAPVAALAGVASPARFFEELRGMGYSLAVTLAYSDHHPYSRGDVRRIFERASAAGALAVLTTEKDFVRLLPHRPFPMPVGWVPLTMEPDPLPEFRRWLAESVDAARDMVTKPESRTPNPEPRVSEPRIPSV